MREYRSALALFFCSAVFVPRSLGEGLAVDAVIAIGWLCFLLAAAGEGARTCAFFAAASGAAVIAVWLLAAPAYLSVLFAFAVAVALRAWLCPPPRRRVLLAFSVALMPLVPALLAWTFGGEDARAALASDFRLPRASFDVLAGYGQALGVVTASLLVLSHRNASRAVVTGAGVALVLLIVFRARTFASLVVLPGDAQWSEPPILLNLLKLRLGAPFYGPVTSCNSYSYSPALETVHRALLAPLGLDLSLLANRVLGFGWHALTLVVLVVALVPFFAAPGRTRLPTAAFLAAALSLVVTSSFLASNLHPDHLLMLVFAPALALALHGERLPRKVLVAGLILVPALCTTVKLTGAGVGLGLAFAFALPLRRANLLALAGGACASVLALVTSERLFPGFWEYTYRLQASHPIDWSMWKELVREPPCRLALVGALALLGSRWLGPEEEMRAARRDAARVMLLTLGFALPSAIAYLKVGGRANSLLPVAIGSAVALARLAAVVRESPRWTAAAAALAVWGALEVMARIGPIPADFAAVVVRRHEQAVMLVKRERAERHRVLFYEGTRAWLDAEGTSELPRDRLQIMKELILGKHREVDQCLGRLADGTYESIVVTGREQPPLLTMILDAHYDALPLAPEEPSVASLPPPRVYRWRP